MHAKGIPLCADIEIGVRYSKWKETKLLRRELETHTCMYVHLLVFTHRMPVKINKGTPTMHSIHLLAGKGNEKVYVRH